MGYYQAGDYYRGDGNYAAGGLFSFLGKAAKAVVKASPIGQVVQAVAPTVFGPPPVLQGFQGPIAPVPGLKGIAQRAVPGGASGFMVVKRRKMNTLNLRALRRAGRRVRGFLRIASRMGALPVNRGKKGKLFKRKAR